MTKTTRIKQPDFRQRVDDLMNSLIKEFYSEVKFARHMKDDHEINLDYYKRHTVETILRIRLKRTVDALAIRYFTKKDPIHAKAWSHYTEDEMLHDKLFLRDLRAVGMTEEEVYGQEPFLSTKLMMGYLLYGIEYEESPLALISSVYFVEYTTTRTQPQWLDNLEKVLGKDKLRGARAHTNIDLEDDHDDFVWEVLTSLVHGPEDQDKVLDHIRHVYQLYRDYFIELYEAVVERAIVTPAAQGSDLPEEQAAHASAG